MKKSLLFFLAILPFLFLGQDRFLFKREIFTSKGKTLLFRILFPEGYDSSKEYPLVFLHGAGERGDDNEKKVAQASLPVRARAVFLFF